MAARLGWWCRHYVVHPLLRSLCELWFQCPLTKICSLDQKETYVAVNSTFPTWISIKGGEKAICERLGNSTNSYPMPAIISNFLHYSFRFEYSFGEYGHYSLMLNQTSRDGLFQCSMRKTRDPVNSNLRKLPIHDSTT